MCLIAWNIRDGHHTTLASKHVFFRSEKKTNRLTLFLFFGEYFHERRVIAEVSPSGVDKVKAGSEQKGEAT